MLIYFNNIETRFLRKIISILFFLNVYLYEYNLDKKKVGTPGNDVISNIPNYSFYRFELDVKYYKKTKDIT